MTKHQEREINGFVRDVCSVVPRSKSEVRRRLNRILLAALEAQSSELKREIEKLRRTENFHHPEYEDGFNQALDEILNK